MKDNNHLHTAGQSRNAPKLMVLLGGQEQEPRCAEKLQQDAGMTFVPELVTMLNGLEAELRQGDISAANQQWLAQCRLTPEQIKTRWSRNIYSREKSTCTTATTGGCCGADLNGQISEMYRRKITNKLHSGTAPHLFITYHY